MIAECPTEQKLLAFHLGELEEIEVDDVSDHLEACPHCEDVVRRFDDRPDALLSALRKPVPPSSSLFRSRSGSSFSGPDLLAPENWPKLPGYEILSALGRGGMGVVYEARHLRLNRLVALKRFRPNGARALARSRFEAEALSRVQHPNIVQIYEIIEHEGEIYLALELIEDGTLGARLRGKPQPPRETAELLEAVARAVHAAHCHGIIHRDLKPSNILLRKNEARRLKENVEIETSGIAASSLKVAAYIPKLTDFSVAKRMAVEAGETRDGDVIGTPAYMAPEQALGKPEQIVPGTDVYSLGVILYEMLTGRVPLQGPTTLETLILVRSEDPLPPRRLVPRVPRDLETICLKSLAKDVAKRYASAADLADDLQRYRLGEPIKARPTGTWERFWKWAKRRPVVAGLAAALAFVTVLGFVLVATQWLRAEHEAANQKQASRQAQENESREKAARLKIEKLAADMSINKGVQLCEGGDVGRGLLWLVRALEHAERVGETDLEHAARVNLAAWAPSFVRQRALCPHTSWVWTVEFSRDGHSALTASIDKTAQVWDTATGAPRGLALKHKLPVWSAVFSPDATQVLTLSEDFEYNVGAPRGPASVLLWDAKTSKQVREFSPPLAEGDTLLAAFLPDGKRIVAVTEAEGRIWRMADGATVGTPFKHPAPAQSQPGLKPMMAAALAPDGKTVATGGEDGTVRFWDTDTARARGEPITAAGPIFSLAYSPDGRTLALGCQKGEVQLWDVASGRQRGATLQLGGLVLTLAFSLDSRLVAAGGIKVELDPITNKRHNVGGEVRIWQTETGFQVGPNLPHASDVRSLAFSPGGRLLVTGSVDGKARFFAVGSGDLIGRPLGQNGTVTSVAYSPDGTLMFASCAGGGDYLPARLWDAPRERAFPQPLLQDSDTTTLVLNGDGRSLLTGSKDGVVRQWDVAARRVTLALPPAEGLINHLCLSPDGKSCVASNVAGPTGQSGVLRFWDLRERRERHQITFPSWVDAFAFSPDGRRIVLAPRGRKFRSLDPESGRLTAFPNGVEGGVTQQLEFSRDGSALLSADLGGVRLWDGDTLRPKQWWRELGPTATFYQNGSQILSLKQGYGGFWDPADPVERSPAPFQSAVGFSNLVLRRPDDRLVLTRAEDGVVRLWDVVTGHPVGPVLLRDGNNAIAFSGDGRRLAAAGKNGRVVLWDVPVPVSGDVERLRLWIEVLTGMELDTEDVVHPLSADAVQERRPQLEELGGAPRLDKAN